MRAFGDKPRAARYPPWAVADQFAKIGNLSAGTHKYKTLGCWDSMGGRTGGRTTAATCWAETM
jgi:hypothetical protein